MHNAANPQACLRVRAVRLLRRITQDIRLVLKNNGI